MSAASLATITPLFARAALAAAFASAVADRFGWWGPPGAQSVAWGDWSSFVTYTGVLTWYLPDGLAPVSAVGATAAEVVLAAWLSLGVRIREAGIASAALLLVFGISMTGAHGVKAALDYSVFSACAAALLLAAKERNNETVDGENE